MARFALVAAVALIALSPFAALAQPAPANAASAATNVCGKPIAQDGDLSWTSFNRKRVADGSDFDALRDILSKQSATWNASLRDGMVSAFDSLASDTGTMLPADFGLSKTADLPARQFAFAHTSFERELPVTADEAPCKASPNAASDLNAAGSFVALVERVLAQQRQDRTNQGVARLKTLETYYDAYLFDGFPMFPWEAAANSWLIADRQIANGPPRSALVLLHPSAGVVAGTKSESSDAGGTLAIEPLGWIRYSADYKTWYGASLLAVFPTDRNRGYGVAFNYKVYKLGVVWQDGKDDKGHDGTTIFIGADLLKLRKGDGEGKDLWGLLKKDK